MGFIIRSVVRNAAKLAVYDATIINEKNPQILLIIRVEIAFGYISGDCCINVPIVNQKLSDNVNWLPIVILSKSQGLIYFHSMGDIFPTTYIQIDTRKYAISTYIQISIAKGFINENNRVGSEVGT